MVEVIKQIRAKVIKGNITDVENLTQEAINSKLDPEKIMNEGFIPALDVVGEKYITGEFFLPEMLMSGMAVKAGMGILRPLLARTRVEPKGIAVVGTVMGDTHDIGKNIVCMMMEGSGFKVIDLGTDVSAEKFINAAKENRADIIGISALLSTTRAGMRSVIVDIRASELKHNVRIMVGGAPVTQDFADAIGADGYAPDAGLAVKKARELLGVR
jgi:5-methyltetrahydrofolate--homocysteine methyltransferase